MDRFICDCDVVVAGKLLHPPSHLQGFMLAIGEAAKNRFGS